ncbi:MAG: hypothetical protein IJ716_14580 [Lachnospiraceae bacterium]|nr:hypothetical protein [Lachnospiraceae bacterium]
MTKNEYANRIAELVGGKVVKTDKVNGIEYTGIVIPPNGTGVSPIFYIDGYYANGCSVLETVEMAKKFREQHKDFSVDINWIRYYEKVKPHLHARLYNKATKAEVFVSAEQYGFEDLILVPYVTVGECASAKVTNKLLETWNVTKEELMQAAINNIQYRLFRMSDLLNYEWPFNDLMIIVTNPDRLCGASSIIKAHQALKEMFPYGYLVLPSSVHEVMVVPKEEASYDCCLEMVSEVNRECVDPEEWLSDNVYIF